MTDWPNMLLKNGVCCHLKYEIKIMTEVSGLCQNLISGAVGEVMVVRAFLAVISRTTIISVSVPWVRDAKTTVRINYRKSE